MYNITIYLHKLCISLDIVFRFSIKNLRVNMKRYNKNSEYNI